MSLALPRRRLVLADLVPGSLVRDVVLIVVAAALTGLAAQVAIKLPFTPVPITLQTFTVLLGGAALGPLRGAMSMLLYMAVGSLGVPWFANGASGFGGPTFGYVIGFVIAAAIVGALARRGADRNVIGTVAMMVLGNLVIYAVGVPWLMVSLGLDPSTAMQYGLTPFLLGDGLKVLLAAGLLPGTWRLIGSADEAR